MILAWNLQKPWQAQKNKNAPNIDRHQKKTKNPATTPKWTHSSGKKIVFLLFLVPAQVWWLWLHNIDKHQTKQKQTTRCTKHRQAPKKTKKKSSNYSKVDR